MCYRYIHAHLPVRDNLIFQFDKIANNNYTITLQFVDVNKQAHDTRWAHWTGIVRPDFAKATNGGVCQVTLEHHIVADRAICPI